MTVILFPRLPEPDWAAIDAALAEVYRESEICRRATDCQPRLAVVR